MIEKGVSSGQGGQGMVLVGELIIKASLKEGLEASGYPSYGPEIRGGAAHLSYVISDSPIANPVVSDFDVAIIMNNYSMAQFVCDPNMMAEREKLKAQGMRVGDRRLKNKGVLIYNSSLITRMEVPDRPDLKIYGVPASEITSSKIPNMILLGAYMQVKGRPKISTLEEIFKGIFTGKKAGFIDANIKDINIGMEYILKNY